jgi:hypothetical protein
MANASSGSAPRASSTDATIPSTSPSSSNPNPRLFAGSTSARTNDHRQRPLRRHVADRAQHLSRSRRRGLRRLHARPRLLPHQLRQPEVQNLHPPVRRHEQVLRLQVPVHDPLRVRRVQTSRPLHRERQNLLASRAVPQHVLPQGLPLQKLRHHVGNGGRGGSALTRSVGYGSVGADVEHRQDVRVIERRHRPRLALEPQQPLGVARHRLRQHLDRHLAPEPRVASPVHLPHPPGPQQAENLVRPQPRTGGQGHGAPVTRPRSCASHTPPQ